MRTREKFFVAVVVVALILGSVIVYMLQSNEVEANYTRWLFSRNLREFLSSPMVFLFGSSESSNSTGALFYGILGLFCGVVMTVVLKMFRDGQIMALKERLQALGAAKTRS